MSKGPVRVAVISRSPMIREGLVGLIGHLRGGALVVDTSATSGKRLSCDVVVYDLDAVHDDVAVQELRYLTTQNLAVIGLVYQAGSPGITPLAPIINLTVTADKLHELLRKTVQSRPTAVQARADRFPSGLSTRELDMLISLGAGMSNQEIAEQLYLGPNTVKTFIRTAYKKIGVTSRSQAMLWCIGHGLTARPLKPDPMDGNEAE